MSILFPLWDADSSQWAAGALPLAPCHTHVPPAPSTGKFGDLDAVGGLSLLSPAPGNILQPEEPKGLPLSPAVVGWRNDHKDTGLFLGNTDPHLLLEYLHFLVTYHPDPSEQA